MNERIVLNNLFIPSKNYDKESVLWSFLVQLLDYELSSSALLVSQVEILGEKVWEGEHSFA